MFLYFISRFSDPKKERALSPSRLRRTRSSHPQYLLEHPLVPRRSSSHILSCFFFTSSLTLSAGARLIGHPCVYPHRARG